MVGILDEAFVFDILLILYLDKLLNYMLYKNISQCILSALFITLCIYTPYSSLPKWGVDMFNTLYILLFSHHN